MGAARPTPRPDDAPAQMSDDRTGPVERDEPAPPAERQPRSVSADADRVEDGRPLPRLRRRASAGEVRYRVNRVREWIEFEDVTDWREIVRRVRDEFGVGRRQALRYYAAARAPALSEEDRRALARELRLVSRTGSARWLRPGRAD